MMLRKPSKISEIPHINGISLPKESNEIEEKKILNIFGQRAFGGEWESERESFYEFLISYWKNQKAWESESDVNNALFNSTVDQETHNGRDKIINLKIWCSENDLWYGQRDKEQGMRTFFLNNINLIGPHLQPPAYI